MTLQELFRTIWFSRWLVLVAVAATIVGAWWYLERQVPVHVATATVQLVDAETLTAAGVRLDTDPSLTTSPAVTAVAAQALGQGARADDLARHVTGGYLRDIADRVTVDASSSSATDSVEIANAVAGAYVAALQAQFDSGVASMQERLAVLGESIAQRQAAVNATRAAEAADGLIEAQYAASMDQYQTLAAQVSQAQLIAAPSSIRQNAVTARLTSLPPSLIYLVALLGGLLLGIGLAIARRTLDTKLRTVGGARRASGSPVLARLTGTQAAHREHARSGDLPVAIRTATPYTQSVRELRTAVQAAVEGSPGMVIVVTAADLDAPRSFIAANLAASWALSGRSVVALSGDLRQPRLNALLPAAEGDAGWRDGMEVDLGDHSPEPTHIPHLRVLPALRTELDPADFLASDIVRDLVEQLRASVDVVIIDAPPMLVAADATIIGAYADGVVLAATIGRTEIAAIEESADRLRAANARLLGVVLEGPAGSRRSDYTATYRFTGDTAFADAARERGRARDAVLLDTP
ncbi:tyrosine-protein kinase domain-containing protein [Cellulomonas timonensis]|uniref:tyrosine-protein kinase domain-containing protein n=1 Tax=Cellulomonas timonensis TaxID=1689271 RepID=UPI0008328CBC|nr:CpsD/CapB family tyrosine-protein kinase [Cellulomonas timonensis]